jgi:glycosyltransferase involved in cell wall biosynthesis
LPVCRPQLYGADWLWVESLHERIVRADQLDAMTGSLGGCRVGLLTASSSRLGGGVAEAVMVQAETIRALGGEAVVFALADAHGEDDRARHAPGMVHLHAVRGPAQIGYAPSLVNALLGAKLDCLHLHGIWMYPSHAGAVWARATGKPYVISPHGMLDPWITRRSRIKKAVARFAYEHDSWRRAAAFHALTLREAGDIARQSGRTDSLVIANAGPPLAPPPRQIRAPNVLYIGRIHPKKNLLALVEAWARLDPQDGARLTIAGWGDDGAVAELRAALAAAPVSAEFVGPVYGEAKQRLLDEARFTILPSLSEGLPMAVLEGWAAGVPAIISDECNLPEARAAGAALDSGFTAQTIAAGLGQALGLGAAEWLTMAQASQTLAKGRYSVGEISAQWGRAYARLLDRDHNLG